MEYVCSHCRHTGTDWIVSGDSVVCPQCFKFTLKEQAIIRKPEPPKTDLPPGFREIFGW